LYSSVSNALAAERRTKQYIASHPVEPPPEDPAKVMQTYMYGYVIID